MTKNTEKKNMVERPPVIAVMGHIDHGKSALLDYIRKSNTVEGEAGGITQHISAYEVIHKTDSGESSNSSTGREKKITFLDTPGHAAFTAMRLRGANIADIAILIVSAEEGPKPQTIEALESIQKAGVPFVIAINKIDKPEANIERTKQQLLEKEIYVEGYGGDIPWVAISAKTGEGIEELLDTVLLIAEMEELKGDLEKSAQGFILETKLDPRKGVCATLIIKDGKMDTGCFIVSGDKIASVRTIENFLGEQIKEATFSSPVQVTGFKEIPDVGSAFKSFDSKKEAEEEVNEYKELIYSKKTNEKIAEEKDEEKTIIPLVIKADVLGTIEAIQHEIDKLIESEKIKKDRVILKTVATGVGNITENDIYSAGGSENTIVVGFNVKIEKGAKDIAEKTKVEVEVFDIIYKLTEWIEEKINQKTPKISTEKATGKAKILKIFSQTKTKQVVGGKVKEGNISLGSTVKILRRDQEIDKGEIVEIQSQKISVKDVKEGDEFGAMIETKTEIAPGDYIEAYTLTEE